MPDGPGIQQRLCGKSSHRDTGETRSRWAGTAGTWPQAEGPRSLPWPKRTQSPVAMTALIAQETPPQEDLGPPRRCTAEVAR